MDEVEELRDGFGLVRLQVPDEVLSHRRKCCELLPRFLDVVFSDVGQPGGDRGRDSLERLPFADADDGYAAARTPASIELLIDGFTERLITIRGYTADALGAASVRAPGRCMQ